MRLVNDNNVKFRRPVPSAGDGGDDGDGDADGGAHSADDFFSIFMIHQNRCVCVVRTLVVGEFLS